MLRRFTYGTRYRGGFSESCVAVLVRQSQARRDCREAYNAWVNDLQLPATLKVLRRERFASIKAGKSDKKLTQEWYLARREAQGSLPTAALWCALNKALAPLWWQWRHRVFRQMRQSLKEPLYNLFPVAEGLVEDTPETGSLVYLFSRPVPVERLMNGELPVSVLANGRHAHLTMPVARQGKDYITEHWDFTMHRPLPAGSLVSEVAVSGRIESGQWRLSISFLLDAPETTHPGIEQVAPYLTTSKHYLCGHQNLVTRCGDIVCAGCGLAYDRDENAALWLRGGDDSAIGIDVGWRMTKQGVRVATACLDEAHFESLHLPPTWVIGWDYVEDLDADLNGSALALRPALSRRRIPWMELENESGQADVDEWLKKTARKRQERRAKRLRLERWRLDLYRNFAKRLASLNRKIRIEKLNLKNMMRAESRQGPAQKQQQQMAAVSELQRVIKEACGV